MTETEYLVWLVVMAVATIVVLVVGTMAAAGLFPRQRRAEERRARERAARRASGGGS